MTRKAECRILLDVTMTLALMFLMGYHLWGDVAHEWVGAGMFVLFVAHHLLNARWHGKLFSGKYAPLRIFQTFLVALLFLAMLAQMYSGVVMSNHVFVFLSVDGGMALARKLHILGSHWGFILMSLHLGLHWGMLFGLVKRGLNMPSSSKLLSRTLFGIGFAVAIYGSYVFVRRDFLSYMFLRSEFVFLDFGESKPLFYLDYFALMGFWTFAAHYLALLLRGFAKGRAPAGGLPEGGGETSSPFPENRS